MIRMRKKLGMPYATAFTARPTSGREGVHSNMTLEKSFLLPFWRRWLKWECSWIERWLATVAPPLEKTCRNTLLLLLPLMGVWALIVETARERRET